MALLTNFILQVPGLYQPEELDANASALKELAANNNFEGNMIQYFTQSKLT